MTEVTRMRWLVFQYSLASLAPHVRDARKGIIFRTARVGILAERLFFIAGLYPR